MSDRWMKGMRWSPHRTFGLRVEWVRLYLDRPDDWQQQNSLGPRQIDAFRSWLVTSGLAQGCTASHSLYRLFLDTWPSALLAWQILWTNCVSAFDTATWYVHEMGLGSWESTFLAACLARRVSSIAPRTAYDAILELVGLLERTPVGTELGQGIVEATRPRRVRRVGLAEPHPAALAHAARLLFLKEDRCRLGLEEDLLWPWTVFGCTADSALVTLASASLPWLRVQDGALLCTAALEVLDGMALF